jgi:hypothetical protein
MMREQETVVLQHGDSVKLVVGEKMYRLIEDNENLRIMLVECKGKLCFPIRVVPHASNVIILE